MNIEHKSNMYVFCFLKNNTMEFDLTDNFYTGFSFRKSCYIYL